MALKVELKPNERIIIGSVVIRNDEQRTRFFIEGEAPILREKDILTAASADTPAKKIYLSIQLMYLAGDATHGHEVYFQLVRDFVEAAPSSLSHVHEINNRILSGDLYKALKAAKTLIAYEADLIENAKRI
ncbi:flagellar biosynthesis repressor FlbT [Bosea sp. Tri-44]|uniref:flagellar biosynthesis repressor FlbT n=1 Tax=Bosea sp. Tri-44 TaxID=1972137 RepID=UPI00100EF370|nr:flagellar biosynthesis repressor FlbT [Bosea sp. Tri-44]RXT56927.1 flagellar biosynthesis repressor FlbT [Bosea sp. Tri-44]